MGLGVASLAVLGLSLFFMVFVNRWITEDGNFYNQMTMVLEALAGFSLVLSQLHYLQELAVEYIQKQQMLGLT